VKFDVDLEAGTVRAEFTHEAVKAAEETTI
jgi:hypothetical protein